MITHYIILSSAYSQGERIALDFPDIITSRAQEIIEVLKQIKNECGNDVPLSTHCIETDGIEWESVEREDAFFRGVLLIESVSEFIRLIKRDRVLTGLDVAKYILTVQPCTHLRLEKLVYLCYAEYLCATGGKGRLFEDEIYAYRYGPVTKTVYVAFKGYGYDVITPQEAVGDNKTFTRKNESSAKSRIMFSDNGLKKLETIAATLLRYGKRSAGELIDVTHREGSPWSRYDSNKADEIIKDEDILAFHCNEK